MTGMRGRHHHRGRDARRGQPRAAAGSRIVLAPLTVLALALPISGCGADGRAASAIDDGAAADELDDPTLRAAPTSTVAPTTPPTPSTAAPTSTAAATTAPTTSQATVVVTLPTPEPPPEPRAEEPYVELGRLQIPRIDVDTTLLQGITLTTLDRGPGHWPGTALPGRIGNSVIAGHRTSHDKVFRHLDQLLPGDEVLFTTAEGTFTYRVRETTVVTPDAMYIIEQTWEPTATLFACHPPGSTRERIVVHLDLVGEPLDPAA